MTATPRVELTVTVAPYVAKIRDEIEQAIALAESVGFSREDARTIVSRMRKKTPWDNARIRRQIATSGHEHLTRWLWNGADRA